MKRLLDLTISFVLLLLIWPMALWTACQVRRKLGRPVFFQQIRQGLEGQPFRMVKFRSMTNELGPDGQLLPDKERLPPFGRWLRASSLDELPELWNVLKGGMSLVGPRPALPSEVAKYNYDQIGRLHAIPGITGLQQVSGRSDVDFKRWVELDLQYISEQSIWKDIEILVKTIPAVLSSKGAY